VSDLDQSGRARTRATALAASAGAVVPIALASWAILVGRDLVAGLLAAISGGLLLVGAVLAHADALVRERTLDSFMDRLYDGTLLSTLAWTSRNVDVQTSAAALLALAASFLGAYIRARGNSLEYRVEESAVTRGLRYALVALALLTSWTSAAMWTLVGAMTIAALVRASQVAKEERA
jgi:hypothetical protein